MRFWVEFGLMVLVGTAIFYIINSMFLVLQSFLDLPVPEAKHIAADMSFTAQIGTVLVLIFVLLPTKYRPTLPGRPLVGLVVVLALVCSLAMAFLWKEQLHGRSVTLWTIAAFAGSIGSLGNVVAWQWCAERNTSLLPAMSSGMAAGALIPSLISIVMQPGNGERFSVEVYYLIAAAIIVCSILSFLALDRTRAQAGAMSASVPLLINDSTINPTLQLYHAPQPTLFDKLMERFSFVKRHSFFIACLLLCLCSSLIFGWQPGLFPYIIPGGRALTAYQVCGQVADVLGRICAGNNLFKGVQYKAAFIEVSVFATMLFLAFLCNQSRAWFTPTMCVLNSVFAFSYGVTSTRFMMSTANNRNVEVLGSALSLGSGIGGVGVYFLVQNVFKK
eukprot:m.83867 g.83867  ORF g.83867 m.83867 type:complete len:389 (-) comp8700_c0_seq22:1144-2310(-)